MGWSYKFWKKSFYPNDLNSSEYLRYYASQFDTIEVNTTFYRIPNEKTVLSWKEQTPPNFIFSLKFPRKITHFKMLTNSEKETSIFLKRASLLNEKLGPLLIQFPYNFTEEKLPKLQKFLKNLPSKYRYSVEVRNKKLLNNKLFSILKEYNVALAWSNHPLLPAIEEITADFLYIRWKGNKKIVNGTLGKTEVDQSANIETWANKIATQMGSRRIFGYFSKYFSGNPAKDIKELLNTIKKAE